MATITSDSAELFDLESFEALAKRRLFFNPAFEIYYASDFGGDLCGLYDYGPPGCALQANSVNTWRKHFVLGEGMLEPDCTALTPKFVFKTSGRVDRFEDWIFEDPKKRGSLRADHLVESVLEGRLKGDAATRGTSAHTKVDDEDAKEMKRVVKDIKAVNLDDAVAKEYEEILARINNYDGAEPGGLIKKHDIRNPDTGNEVLPPVPFNLIFKTSIGPSSGSVGYLRLETAQGQFVNFKKLLEYNQNTMPFASTCRI